MARHENTDWKLETSPSYDDAKVALLMDIRDELQTLNEVFRCSNALAIPGLLRDIKRNTTTKKRRTT